MAFDASYLNLYRYEWKSIVVLNIWWHGHAWALATLHGKSPQFLSMLYRVFFCTYFTCWATFSPYGGFFATLFFLWGGGGLILHVVILSTWESFSPFCPYEFLGLPPPPLWKFLRVFMSETDLRRTILSNYLCIISIKYIGKKILICYIFFTPMYTCENVSRPPVCGGDPGISRFLIYLITIIF